MYTMMVRLPLLLIATFVAIAGAQGCTEDAKSCPDGTVVSRNPELDCDFDPCPDTGVFCTQDVEPCPDGSFVGRDPKNGCSFFACPDSGDIFCTQDVATCPDGSFVGRDPKNNCEFYPCPVVVIQACTMEECGPQPLAPNYLCSDGVTMAGPGDCVRNADGTCGWEFVSCPEPKPCTDDVMLCPDGTYVSRDPNQTCEFESCFCCDPKEEPGMFGNPLLCKEGHRCCPSGEWSCSIGDGKTFPCGGNVEYTGPFGYVCKIEETVCTLEAKICPDGTEVSRNPEQDCAFDPCPCCEAAQAPTCLVGDPMCCLNGEWGCPNDQGMYTCNCDPNEGYPYCLIGIAACCPDGTWVCPDGTTNEYPCSGGNIKGPFKESCPDSGVFCPQDVKTCPDGSFVGRDPKNGCSFFPCPDIVAQASCCDPKEEPGMFGNPLCFEGHRCCPSGEWSCSIGDGKTFPCGGNGDYTGPFGQACKIEEPVCHEEDCGPRSKAPNYLCEDGITVAGPTDQCEYNSTEEKCAWVFVTCPDPPVEACSKDAKTCPDGTVVSRNPDLDCDFDPCPCCEAAQAPTCLVGDPLCCLNGEWGCPNDQGMYTCGCDSQDYLYCFIGDAACCPDGTWACPDGTTNEYPCSGGNFKGPFKESCPELGALGGDISCCDASQEPAKHKCRHGHVCCDGEWTCLKRNGSLRKKDSSNCDKSRLSTKCPP